MEKINYAKRSLEGVWVGDCIGNLGQLYFAHDILKALEEGAVKFGGQLNKFQKQFQYSDDTEEAIVLYNHLVTNQGVIDQDKLAKEFAERYWTRDPDGEIYGYGLNTRKVLKDIYDGVPWVDANKIIPKSEGMPSHIDSLVGSLSQGDDYKEAMHKVNATLRKEVAERAARAHEKQGSCGNGSAMRVAPLGAYIAQNFKYDGKVVDEKLRLSATDTRLLVESYRQAEVTHCHPEGIAGSIAITALAHLFTEAAINSFKPNVCPDIMYDALLKLVPQGQVYDGIVKAQNLPFNTPIGKAIELLGNGTHVTCQDTVPLCCWLAIKYYYGGRAADTYEKAIIETSIAFGDVDTNCAIVGGMIGIVCPAPEKWVRYCMPMEGVVENSS